MNKISNTKEIAKIRKIINAELIKYRKEYKMTQIDMASKLKTSQAFYQLLEKDGSRDIGIAKLLAYCKTLSDDTKLFVNILKAIVKEIENDSINEEK